MKYSTMISVSVLIMTMEAKVYKKCEFAQLAKESGLSDVDKWTCIAFRESRFNTKAKNGNLYGILQISSEDWCGRGRKCGISCESLLDADIKDDLHCAKQIYNTTARRTGRSGFSSWSSSNYCKGDSQHWINKCDI